MSIIATIGAIILMDYNEDNPVGLALIGPAMWITLGFCWLIRKIVKTYKYWNLRAIMVDNNGDYFYCKSCDAQCFEFCEEHRYKFTKFNTDKFNPLDWDKEFQIMGIGNQRYAPRKVWKKFPPIPKSELKYAKEHRSGCFDF